MERLNGFLTSRGLPQHVEPQDCEVWSGEMIGYSGLHDLRRLAAHWDSGERLPPIVLNRDLPEHALCEGDLGAVVQVYEPDGLEVEFVSASGKTAALVTLKDADVRAVAEGDLLAVRRLDRSA